MLLIIYLLIMLLTIVFKDTIANDLIKRLSLFPISIINKVRSFIIIIIN